ncbi:Putative SWI/SNF-like matrix-associated actin-dependent regulator [Leucoagaricus sp. SymC.cos]|nr:Putative SWI/SNF-like matrix-associated actin-dependent regulator [Leucoagaricus sp. SymC.cos]
MAATAGSGPPISSLGIHSRNNPIDLTQDDDEPGVPQWNSHRSKRAREDSVYDNISTGPCSSPPPFHPPMNSTAHNSSPHSFSIPNSDHFFLRPQSSAPPLLPLSSPPATPYRPPFAGSNLPSVMNPYPQPHPQFSQSLPSLAPPPPRDFHLPPPFPFVLNQRQSLPPNPTPTPGVGPQVIDLTDSPSPPPAAVQNVPPGLSPVNPNDPPKTPVCIGQLTVNALILYPINYLMSHDPSTEYEWAAVRLQYEHDPHRMGNPDTIHIRTPSERSPTGEVIPGENFAVVEQKVATTLGGMLGKGLIRLEAKIRRGKPNLPVMQLQLLVYTPKGNIMVVGNYLQQCNLLLDHPIPPFDHDCRLAQYPYYNPHNPPPGGHSRPLMLNNRLYTPSATIGKTQDVQRTQVDELFRNLKDGVELSETESHPDVATKLYPHQKKALTFLLDREREKPIIEGHFSTLWRTHIDSMSQQKRWVNIVTEEEAASEPKEARGSILADDMGLGKTITCVSLIAATLQSAKAFAAQPLEQLQLPPKKSQHPNASHFAGAVWGMPESPAPTDSKSKKAERDQERLDAEYVRACRIKARSRATLIICPLSTVANWEDQFREHWRGEVTVVGGSGNCVNSTATSTASSSSTAASTNGANTPDSSQGDSTTASSSSPNGTAAKSEKSYRVRDGTPLRVYIYHGNARRPDPAFLTDFDAVITTYATLASEFSKQNRTAQAANEDGEDTAGGGSSDGGISGSGDRWRGGGDPELEIVEVQTSGMSLEANPKPKKTGTKRKKPMTTVSSTEVASPLQSIHWFRVVLDEAHSIKEIQTVGCRASCDLIADRRLCLTGTPVQNKLDDMFALIKFLRLTPFDDKNVWTKHISAPAKFGQREGIIRLRTIMDCITLRRTKETKSQDGRRILALPPREDTLVRLELSKEEQEIYHQYFSESKAEFTDLSNKNQVMKNYVGILQKLLRLRQICDHKDLIEVKSATDSVVSYEEIVAAIAKEGINPSRASAIFTLLREATTTQCTECGGELCAIAEGANGDAGGLGTDSAADGPPPNKRGRKSKGQTSSRAPTRASSPSGGPRPILTRCQHLFCIECYRSSICPGWPDVPSTLVMPCSACQTELQPMDVVEIKPDMIAEGAGGEGKDGKDGKKVKKKTKEERMKKLEKRLQEIEARLIQEQDCPMQQSQSQMQTQQTFNSKADIELGGQYLSQTRSLFDSELDIKHNVFKPELDIKPAEMSLPSLLSQPSSFYSGPSETQDYDMRFEMDISSLGLPPPNIREQATAILQEEICERSTKIKALIGRLMPFSTANPHSANYNPGVLDVQIVDSDGNGSTDNVIKTVVFSQWTSMLDKIEDALLIHKIRYDRLDGTMKREERSKALDALKYDPSCEVLLVSLKAGGVGLNLTAAQRVILMDPCWNPAVENQAVDRIHRLGQTKPVLSIRFIISNSVEESMLKIQARKNRLADLTLGARNKSELMEQRMEELKEIFK